MEWQIQVQHVNNVTVLEDGHVSKSLFLKGMLGGAAKEDNHSQYINTKQKKKETTENVMPSPTKVFQGCKHSSLPTLDVQVSAVPSST